MTKVNLSSKADEFNQIISKRLELQSMKQDSVKQNKLDTKLKTLWSEMTFGERKEIEDFYATFGGFNPFYLIKKTWM